MESLKEHLKKEVSINGTYSVMADANGEFAVTNTFVALEFGQVLVLILISSIVGIDCFKFSDYYFQIFSF